MSTKIVNGRCVRLDNSKIWIATESKIHELACMNPNCEVGDIVSYSESRVQVLTKNLAGDRFSKLPQRIADPRRQHAMKIRAQVEQEIAAFFLKQDFHQVRTPTLVRSPGMEPYIRPYQLTTGEFIPTSPEFAMKKLLVGGLEKIFQICPAFRYEPKSQHHHPEFTCLEWYRAYEPYQSIMQDFENLVEALATKIYGKPEIHYGGKTISVKTPWPRLKIRDLFTEIADTDLTKIHDDDTYFKIWLDKIEPNLPQEQACFVHRFPASQAALSVLDTDSDGTKWAKRFEAFAGGLELCNAFEELTNPIEQKKRFTEDMNLRQETHGKEWPISPIDEEFIAALEAGMPPSSGIAVGVDRLIMLLANEPDINYTIWLPSYIHQPN